WRNIPKPTIASVHGRVIAGGLMLVWPMDLVIASEDATFSDPTVAFGLNGLEYHDHLWQLGARKAKEILFTGRALTATEAETVGMVNQVVPRDELESATLQMARTIAERPMFGLKLAKLSVNQGLEAQGQYSHISRPTASTAWDTPTSWPSVAHPSSATARARSASCQEPGTPTPPATPRRSSWGPQRGRPRICSAMRLR
ncbi:MAG: enoyl-CoA hydratase-related protein, partial [Acidimicrobiia bacterium]